MKKRNERYDGFLVPMLETAFLVGLVFAAAMFFGSKVEAAEFLGPKWRNTDTLHWYVDPSCPNYVKTATEVMMNRHSPIKHSYAGKWQHGASRDNANYIYCGSTDVQETQIQQRLTPGMSLTVRNAVAGRAYVYAYETDKRIFECDVWLNTDYLDDQTVYRYVGHEVTGHCMGLDHSPIKSSIMYYAPYRNDFHIDDFAGLTELYSQCHDKDFIDSDGNKYMSRLDVDALLARLNERQYDMWRGIELSAYQYVNTNWPLGLVEIKESSCNL